MEPARYSIVIRDVPIVKIEEHNGGWFMLLEGSWESLFVGRTKPEIRPGDLVTIRIEKQ